MTVTFYSTICSRPEIAYDVISSYAAERGLPFCKFVCCELQTPVVLNVTSAQASGFGCLLQSSLIATSVNRTDVCSVMRFLWQTNATIMNLFVVTHEASLALAYYVTSTVSHRNGLLGKRVYSGENPKSEEKNGLSDLRRPMTQSSYSRTTDTEFKISKFKKH